MGANQQIITEKPERESRSSSRIIVVAGLLISVFFLYIAFRGLQPDAFLDSLSEINPLWLMIGAITYFLAVTVIALRWQFLLRAVKPVPLIPLTKIVAIGYTGNNVYPLRAGEALRLYLLKRHHEVPVTGSATTVVIERIFDGIVMLSFIMIGLTFLDVTSDQIQLVINVASPIFLVAVLVFFGLAMVPDTLRSIVQKVAGFLPERLQSLVLNLSEGVLDGLGSLRSPVHLIGAIIASYSTWAIEAGVYWMVMIAFGLELGYPVALLVVGTVNLAGLIPASPGQIGVYEFFASAVLTAVGVAQNTALAYAIVVHIVIWLPVTLAGFAFLVQYGLGWGAITGAKELE